MGCRVLLTSVCRSIPQRLHGRRHGRASVIGVYGGMMDKFPPARS